jgi:hypothetical protein
MKDVSRHSQVWVYPVKRTKKKQSNSPGNQFHHFYPRACQKNVEAQQKGAFTAKEGHVELMDRFPPYLQERRRFAHKPGGT